MKKIICIGLTISLLFSFSACSKGNEATSEVDTKTTSQLASDNEEIIVSNENYANETLTDKTVLAENRVEVKGKDVKNVVEVNTECCDYAVSSDLSDLSDYASEIIQGTVKEVTYVNIEGNAWIKGDIVVTKSIKGEIEVSDVISVYMIGGYVSLEDHIKQYDDAEKFGLSEAEIKDTVIKSNIENEKFPIVGDESIFYLVQTPSESPLPDGAYERICGKYSELQFNKSSNLFERDKISGNDGDKEKFSLKEVKEKMVNKSKKKK